MSPGFGVNFKALEGIQMINNYYCFVLECCRQHFLVIIMGNLCLILGRLELLSKFLFPPSIVEEVIHFHQCFAKISVQSAANNVTVGVGNFV